MMHRVRAALLCAVAILVCPAFGWTQSGSGGVPGSGGGGGGGSSVGLDTDNDDTLESAGLTRITCKGDSEGVCDGGSPNELILDFDKPVPNATNADFATELAQNPGDCVGEFLRGLSSDGTPNCDLIIQSDLPANLWALYATELNSDQGPNPELSFAAGTRSTDTDKDGTAEETLDSNGTLTLAGGLIAAFLQIADQGDGANAMRVLCNTTDLPEPAAGAMSIGCADDEPSYRLNGGATTTLLGGSGFAPDSDPEGDHSGFDAAVATGADLSAVTTPDNYSPTDQGDSGESLREHLEGLDAQLAPGAVTSGVTFAQCFPVYAPNTEIQTTDDIESVWRAPYALTITEVWCETDTGTVDLDLQVDDGTPADVMGTDLSCDADGEGDSTSLSGAMADGDRLDIAITSVASNPTRLSICVEWDRD